VLAVFASASALSCATIAARLAERIPEGYADITQEAAASQLRALGVPVKNVREDGSVRKGCDRAAVETAAGVVPGA
jgi:S-DNA-T family DNA segregation ATPase FtsK/SpoIIIE